MSKDLNEILQAFDGSVLQSVNQVRKKLREHNVSWKAFDEWVSSKSYYKPKVKAVPCPECGSTARLQEINTKSCNQVAGNWKSMWVCDQCGWNQMNLEPLSAATEIAKKSKPKRKGRIVRPDEHRMLYYGRRRMR